MSLDDELNDDNFRMYAEQAYRKKFISESEFEEEINRIQYIKRLLSRYYRTKVLKELLIRNHLIIFFNVFGLRSGYKLLCFKLEDKDIKIIGHLIRWVAKYHEELGDIHYEH